MRRPIPHGLSKAGTHWTDDLVAYGLDLFHRHHLRTPTQREIRSGIDYLPSYATIRRMYGNVGRMLSAHGYLVRSRGAQPGQRTTVGRDRRGRFVSRWAQLSGQPEGSR